MCEMVFVETLSADTLLDRLPEFEVSHNHTDSQNDSEPITAGLQRPTSTPTTKENTRTLYNAAMILKGLISDPPGMTCPWPPTSDDLNVNEAKSVVPHELFNLISWIIDATEEPTLSCYVNIPDEINLKVISICHDNVYLMSKGGQQTPKSLCLGLTFRH